MNKSFIAKTLIGAGLLGASMAASAANTFTVDGDAYAFTKGFFDTFQADGLTGIDSILYTETAPGVLTGTGFVNINSFNHTNPAGSFTGLDLKGGYDMYISFSVTATLTNGSLGLAGSDYDVTSSYQLFVAPYLDNTANGNPFTYTDSTAGLGFGTDAAVTTNVGATVTLIGEGAGAGSASINNDGGAGVNINGLFSLNADGEKLFTAPHPFYNLAFSASNNTSSSVDLGVDANGKRLVAINNSSVLTIDFARGTIPEPATVALIGLGLLGLGASRRRVA